MNSTDAAARLAAIRARMAVLEARHEAHHGLSVDGDVDGARSAAFGLAPASSAEQGQDASTAARLSSDRALVGGEHRQQISANLLTAREILEADAREVARLHPEIAAAGGTSSSPSAAVLPFVAPPPAVEPEPAESPRERLARRTAETEARMGQMRAEGRARNGGVLPRDWALVAGTALASSVEAPAPADAVYARAGPNRCAPSSPWDRFDLAA